MNSDIEGEMYALLKGDFNEIEIDFSNQIELPEGDYQLFINSDYYLPKFLNINLNQDTMVDIEIYNKGVFTYDSFENSNNWVNNNGLVIEDNQLKSQSSSYYQYNQNKSIRMSKDLSQFDNLDFILKVRLKNELEWDNDKLIFRLSSENSDAYSIIKQISSHNFEWYDAYIPFNIVDERKVGHKSLKNFLMLK